MFVSPRGPTDSTRGQGLTVRCHLEPLFLTDTSGLSCSWGTLLRLAWFFDPGGTFASGRYDARARLADPLTLRAPHHGYFGVPSPDTPLRCLLLRKRRRRRPRQTRYRLLAKLCRVGLITHWVPSIGFWSHHVSDPPIPSTKDANRVAPPVARRGSHRSVRDLTHTALQNMNVLKVCPRRGRGVLGEDDGPEAGGRRPK